VKEIKITFLLLILSGSLAFAQFPQEGLKGHWEFNNASNLEQATVGNNLVLDALAGVTPSQQAAEGPTAGDGAVVLPSGVFYRCNHDLEPNGGGAKVNQYTLIFDFKRPENGVWNTFFGTNADNAGGDDWELFTNSSGHIGVGSTGYSYDALITNEWYRLVVVADLGNYYRYYLDGQLLQDGGAQVLDNRFALSSANETNQVLLLGDNDGEDAPIHVAQIALYDRPLTLEEIEQLGGYGHIIVNRDAVSAWTFDNAENLLQAFSGKDLELTGSHQQIEGPNSTDGAVSIGTGSYYTALHGIRANGGTNPLKVNNYTMVFDVRIPAIGQPYSLFQTNPSNTDNADLFISPEGNIGSDEIGYSDTSLVPGDWYRIVITADLGNKFTVYLDGDSVFSAGSTTADGALALDPYNSQNKILFFADDNGEDGPVDVAYTGIYNRVLSNTEIEALSGFEHGTNTEITGAGQSVYMDGSASNRYMKISKNSDMDFGTSQNFTIELWIKPSVVVNGDPSIISNKSWASGGNPGWILSLRGDDWKFNMGDGNGHRFDFNGPFINDGFWHHIAVIIDRANGARIVTDSLVTTLVTSNEDFFKVGSIDSDYPVVIGQDGTENYSDGHKLPASVDEIRIWKTAVDPQVLLDWRSKKINSSHPNYSDLAGYYSFDEGTGTTAADLSGKGHNAELINNPVWKVSYAPVGDAIINELYNNDVKAIWGALPFAVSGGLTAESSFESSRPSKFISSELAAAAQSEPFAVFGHDNKNAGSESGLPSGVQQRLSRKWYFDVTETPVENASLIFDLGELGGTSAAGIPSNYVLLAWNGSAFSEVSASGITVQNSDQVVISGITLSDNIYTLGTKDVSQSPLGVVTDVETNTMLPKNYELSNAYPNPFNPVTNIKFALPQAAEVKLKIFNILGAEVATLVDGNLTAGYHDIQWNAASGTEGSLSSGVYFYRLTAKGADGKNFSQSKKVILIK
jgi:hypothetical protein